ncbi:hypothetical protein VSDG_07558 [Cytospora chrysosperma]|uniref:Methyltransferase domain-containing protein n=1 Tax=Cytospora chrysosperma TaxID=252740 RepID=A0A423VML9_CYTCH|nr:hypothetical protein VSDG_07558 [Valsa sordida]
MSTTTNTKPEGGYKFGYSRTTTSSHASRTIHTDAAFVIPHIKPQHKILDIGSGPGTITIGFALLVDQTQGGCVIGVDSGDAVVSSAIQLAQKNGLPEELMKFEQGDVLEGLPFPDETFDVVFTSQTLIHLAPAPEAPVKALKEICRLLKPGGFLAARDAASITYHPLREELQRKLTDRLFAVVGTGEPCGLHMQEYLRAAGWDLDKDIVSGKVIISGGSTIVAGREKVRWWHDTMGGRFKKGDPFREGWLRYGFTEEECDETKALLDKWADTEDAWYGVLQSEILAWK